MLDGEEKVVEVSQDSTPGEPVKETTPEETSTEEGEKTEEVAE